MNPSTHGWLQFGSWITNSTAAAHTSKNSNFAREQTEYCSLNQGKPTCQELLQTAVAQQTLEKGAQHMIEREFRGKLESPQQHSAQCRVCE